MSFILFSFVSALFFFVHLPHDDMIGYYSCFVNGYFLPPAFAATPLRTGKRRHVDFFLLCHPERE